MRTNQAIFGFSLRVKMHDPYEIENTDGINESPDEISADQRRHQIMEIGFDSRIYGNDQNNTKKRKCRTS
jgi:hypothetical protein